MSRRCMRRYKAAREIPIARAWRRPARRTPQHAPFARTTSPISGPCSAKNGVRTRADWGDRLKVDRLSPGELGGPLAGAFVMVLLGVACNPLFGIHEGSPRPTCVGTEDAAEPLIDDMEDGDGFICPSSSRHGHWYPFSDQTPGFDLTPAGDFNPTQIPGGRGLSQYAAHLTGSGFAEWGALMGFNLTQRDTARQTYDASLVDGIKFWLRSTQPVTVAFSTLETIPSESGGECLDVPPYVNCGNPFVFQITAPSADWRDYTVPFVALAQGNGRGSVPWNSHNLLNIEFALPAGAAFDTWVDDIRFYHCGAGACLPTCADPAFPKQCPATATSAAGCLEALSDCAVGCGPSNTTIAPANGVITTFDGPGGSVAITDVSAVVPLGPASSAPTFTTEGALRITLNAPATSEEQVLVVDFAFQQCVDATAFTGVQFTIAGSLAGCTLRQATQDSAHLHYNGFSAGPSRHGTGAVARGVACAAGRDRCFRRSTSDAEECRADEPRAGSPAARRRRRQQPGDW